MNEGVLFIIVPVIASIRESDVIILSHEKRIEYKTGKDLRNKETIFYRNKDFYSRRYPCEKSIYTSIDIANDKPQPMPSSFTRRLFSGGYPEHIRRYQ